MVTRDNLGRWGLILESSGCVMCDDKEETGNHVFFSCKIVWQVQRLCSKLIGEESVYHQEAKAHLLGFSLSWTNKKINRVWGCMWITVVGKIWKQKNRVIFEKSKVDHFEVFRLAQLKVCSCVTSKERLVIFTYAQWCIDLKSCFKTCGKRRVE